MKIETICPCCGSCGWIRLKDEKIIKDALKGKGVLISEKQQDEKQEVSKEVENG